MWLFSGSFFLDLGSASNQGSGKSAAREGREDLVGGAMRILATRVSSFCRGSS